MMPFGRLLFYVTVAWGGSLMWLAPQLPLLDLPQHVAQVSLLRDLLSGASPWSDLVHINLFTPYIAEYGLALAFSTVLPMNTAFSLLLTVAYLGLIASCVWLRRDSNGDPRLDWLFIPGFFGFAWEFGFVPFLIACPIGVLFILVARRHASEPDLRGGLWLGILGLVLFFTHGLVFVFVIIVGMLFVSANHLARNPIRWAHLAPYVPLAAIALAYQVVQTDDTPNLLSALTWGGGVAGLVGRAEPFFIYPLGLDHDRLFALATLILFIAPWALRCKLNGSTIGWWIPFVTVVLVFFLAPGSGLTADYMYHRFAIFILPAYALLFGRPDEIPQPRRIAMSLVIPAVAVTCWAYLGVKSVRLHEFSNESAGIDRLLKSLPEEKRLLNLAVDPSSAAADNPSAYQHYAAWYQAYRHGFVDVNFASYHAQMVRFRTACRPAVPPGMESRSGTFDFSRHEGWIYDFILVKGKSPEADAVLRRIVDNQACRMEHVETSGDWTLLAPRECVAPTMRQQTRCTAGS